MNILLIILSAIVGLIALLLLIALFVKKDYVIEREITIGKPKADVFNYIKHLKNQDHYSKWVMTDPNMNKTFTGTDGTEGFIYAWDSTNKAAGKGEQEIKNITEGERLDVEVRFEKPFAGIANTPMITEAIHANGTKLKWGMNGRSKYPMNLMNLFMAKMLGKDLETSLTNLKIILEK
ncbi:MAG: Polyketide cyclase / dehydrase and lipid transport [Flavisolibacter sp.]|nr:Polyketide cyclase / dehydrase and lipid transport [Flavisolibacter sp.]